MPGKSQRPTFVSGNWEIDLARRELRARGAPVPLGSRAFEILGLLAQSAGELVSKSDIIVRVWQRAHIEDNTLQFHISAIRRALGADREMLRTISGRGYRLLGDWTVRRQIGSGAPPELPLPSKPSIAVLAFQNLSDDPEQKYFADGVVEEIITALSRLRWLFVIARNSSFTYEGRAVDVKQIGRELGVRYVLEGSVRKAANRVRISGQLVDAAIGAHLWADRFDGGLEDIFDLQEQVTASVVGAIAPKLEQAEIERSKRKPTESLDAYDYFLRGVAAVHHGTQAANNEALQHFRRAIELDPEFASAYGLAAGCYTWRKANGWIVDRRLEVAETSLLARRSVELGKDDAVALCWGGIAMAYVAGDLDDGAAFIDQALMLDPNLAAAWYNSGWVKVWLGEPDVAIDRAARAMRLSPRDSLIYSMQTVTALAHLLVGRYSEASSWAERALRERGDYASAIRVAAASSALAGRHANAKKAIARLREVDPAFRISDLSDRAPLRRPQDLANFALGLREAGLEE